MTAGGAAGELAALRERVRALAQEKAQLEIVNFMMARMGAARGVEGTVEALLQGVTEHLGGTNATVYWRRDAAFHRADVLGRREELQALLDPRVRAAWETGQAAEVEEPPEATGVTGPGAGPACTWVYPLRVGAEVVGVLVLQGLQASARELRLALPALLAFAALLLKHELEVAARLEAAARQVALAEELRRSQEQLRQAQKMEALGLLAGGVAHDLNNILQVIVAFGTTLRDGLADQPGQRAEQEAVDEVLAGAQRAGELTRGLLAFSRRQPLEQRDLDLGRLAAGAHRLLAGLVGEGVRLELRPAAGPLAVSADAALLQQVLVNLVTNARDATPAGGTVTIATEALPGGAPPAAGPDVVIGGEPVSGPAVSLSVTDTGAGIPPEHLARITEPFFTTNPKGKGTGLGLSIVYGIVKQHGGQLRVRSAPGQGTRVEVVLPRLEARPLEARPAAARRAQVRGESILVVEDDAAVRNAVRAILSGAGYRVGLAADGQEAVELYQRGERYDLVLLDLVMPRCNGQEALERLLGWAPLQRALIMSGYAAEIIDARRLQDLGVPVIMKPFVPEALLLAVQGALEAPPRAPPRLPPREPGPAVGDPA